MPKVTRLVPEGTRTVLTPASLLPMVMTCYGESKSAMSVSPLGTVCPEPNERRVKLGEGVGSVGDRACCGTDRGFQASVTLMSMRITYITKMQILVQ